jgi:hypothetical protein
VILAMCACAAFAWEPWPFTAFRLFSEVRVDEQSAWEARTVDAAGTEQGYPLGGLPEGFRGFPFTMAEFVVATDRRQDELCRTWVGAAPELVGVDAVEVRIYRRSWRLSDRAGERARPGTTELAYVCTSEGLDRAG